MKRYTSFKAILISLVLLSFVGLQIAMAQSGPLFIDSGQNLGTFAAFDVKMGDLDGDGDLDAFVANTLGDANTVWLNTNGVFTDSGQRLGNLNSRGVALGDLDGDGDLDAFIANSSSTQPLKIWLNNGGVFVDSGQNLADSNGQQVALGDVDGDGDLDAFIARGGTYPNKVWLNANGVFTDSGQSLGNSFSYDVALGDLDGDGDLDAFVANTDQPNTVWKNVDGTFVSSGQFMGSASSSGVALADLDGDGDLDAFVANSGGQASKVWLNDGNGVFTDSGQNLGSAHNLDVLLGDLDDDGDLDAFSPTYFGFSEVWLNTNGIFTDSGLQLGNGGASRDAALGDVDGDGDLDAFVVNHNTSDKVWLNTTSTIAALIATTHDTDLYPGDTVTVTLTIEAADDLYAAQSLCAVDPAIVQPQSAIFGNFFDLVNRLIIANTVDAGAGTWFGAVSQQNPAGPISGNGYFATITYQALNPGTTTIMCDPLFSDRDGFTQPVTFTQDTLMVLPFATISGTAMYQGRLNHAGIAVAATGAVTSSNTTGNSGNFTLGQLRAYTYTVRADAGSYLPACSTVSVTPGETVLLSATTLLGGDLNDDDTINIADATLLGSNFGLNAPPAAVQTDINADGVVNVQDLAILAGNYDVTGCQTW